MLVQWINYHIYLSVTLPVYDVSDGFKINLRQRVSE